MRQKLSMLLRREGETATELLTRLDREIAKALTEGIRPDEVNPLKQEYLPNKELSFPICWILQNSTALSMRSQTDAYPEDGLGPAQNWSTPCVIYYLLSWAWRRTGGGAWRI